MRVLTARTTRSVQCAVGMKPSQSQAHTLVSAASGAAARAGAVPLAAVAHVRRTPLYSVYLAPAALKPVPESPF